MVNAHCHLELSFFKGAIPSGIGLVDFIKNVISRRGAYPIQEQIDRACFEDKYMWSQGVQAVGDISNGTMSFKAKKHSRIKYHTFVEYFGMPQTTAADRFFDDVTAETLAAAQQAALVATTSPHSTYLVSDALFRRANDSRRLSIHFMETPAELEFFDRRGGMYEFVVTGGMVPDFLKYGSHPARLVESVSADIPILLIHNAQVKQADVEVVMNHFRDVTFVLCPRSNYYIEGAYPPAKLFERMGAQIAIGTDSLSSNTSLSMIEEVKCLARENPEIPLAKILGWATRGGAHALGLEDSVGSFTPGKHCGAVLLTAIDWTMMRPTPDTRAERLL